MREEGGAHRVADGARRVEDRVGPVQQGAQHVLALVAERVADAPPLDRRPRDRAAQERQGELRRSPLRRPAQREDGIPVQPDERVPVPQRVVEEGELVVARECGEPERQPCHLDGEKVAVHAAEAVHGDQAARVLSRVLVRRQLRRRAGARPSVAQLLRELPARLDEEGAAAHGRVQYA